VLYRQLPSSLLRPGLSAEPVSRMFSL